MYIFGSYTEGISIKCGDDKINASLYNNRSASHFFLENYRSSFNDAKKTLSFEPDHPKALLRAAQCALKLKEFEACTEYCDKILSKDKDNETAKKIKLDIKNYKLIHERDERRKNIKEKKQISEDESLLNAIKERGL